jgi:hypothetical protein
MDYLKDWEVGKAGDISKEPFDLFIEIALSNLKNLDTDPLLA